MVTDLLRGTLGFAMGGRRKRSESMCSGADDAALTTAYPFNARPRIAASVRSGWAPAVDRLLERGHTFLPLTYAGGNLYRGMASGVRAGLTAGYFGVNTGDHPLCALERELGVLLVSQDLADALAVARLWESGADAGVLVFPATVFATRWSAGAAAVLGFAEPGVVFRYPFLVGSLACTDTAMLLVSARAAVPCARRISAGPPQIIALGAATRAGIESEALGVLAAYGLGAARPEVAQRLPRPDRAPPPDVPG
ncbi:MAG: hypothetical protein IT495_08755 [Gammaproteobacteria bacterium]|nr:hypothetical protein [Gammaproteobacteria bacterium]